MIWQPVYIDDKPYYFPLGSFAAYIDYVVTDERGTAIRQGQLDITYKASPSPPVIIDDCDVLRPTDADIFDPELDPDTSLSTIKFRVYPTQQGTMLQYGSNATTVLTLRFKVSTIFHIPGDYFPLMNIGNILGGRGNEIIITMSASGLALEVPSSQPLLMKNNGTVLNMRAENSDLYYYNMEFINGVATDSFGNMYICGTGYDLITGSTTSYYRTAILVKYDSNGEFLWQRGYAQDPTINNFNSFQGLHIDSNDYVVCVGITTKSDTGPIQNALFSEQSGICVKFAPNGDEVFARSYVDVLFSRTEDVILEEVISDGNNLYITGYMTPVAQYSYEGFAARIDPTTGDIIWINHLTSGLADFSNAVYMNNIAFDSAGNIIQCGKLDYSTILLRKYNAQTGAVMFTKAYTGYATYAWWDYTFYTVADDDCIYHTEPEPYDGDSFLITKFDANGDLVWQKRHGYTDWSFYLGFCHTFITSTKIFVLTSVEYYYGYAYKIIELDLDGNYIRDRHITFPTHESEGDMSEAFVTMKDDYFYIGFNDFASFPELRLFGKGILVVPVEWDGIEVNYENMLMVRAPIPNTIEVFDRFNEDNTLTITAVPDPYTTFALTESTVARIEAGEDFQFTSAFVNDPVANVSVAVNSDMIHFPVNPNVLSGGNYWASCIMPLAPDVNYNDFFQPYPLGSTCDAAGNIYTTGFISVGGIYGSTDVYYIQKTLLNGTIEWVKKVTNSAIDIVSGTCISVDDTGIYITEGENVSGVSGIIVSKYSLAGDAVLWSKRIRTNYMYAYDSAVVGNELHVIADHNSQQDEGYLIKLDKSTGAMNPSTVAFLLEDVAEIFTKYFHRGTHYYIMCLSRTNFDWGYTVTKHVASDNSVVWQRKGYVDHTLTTSQRIDIEPMMCMDDDDNIYISGTIVDLRNYNRPYPSRRLMVKMDSSGDLLEQKIFKVTMENGVYHSTDRVVDCFWIGGRIMSVSMGDKDYGTTFTIDAFDTDLNLLWSRIIYMSGDNYVFYDPRMTTSTDDSLVIVTQFIEEYNWSYVLRIPLDGVFDFKGETGLLLYDLTYEEVTDYTAEFDTQLPIFINTITNTPPFPFTIQDVTDATIVPYTTYRTFKSDI